VKRQISVEYLKKKFGECPDLISDVEQYILSGYYVIPKNPHGVLIIDDKGLPTLSRWRVDIWRNQGVWKIEFGYYESRASKGPGYMQCDDLEDILFYLRRWKEKPPVYKK
jgi:hypothetical protein